LYFPALPLEALVKGKAPASRAVVDEQQGIPRVLLASAEAAAAGISSGMSVNAALALDAGVELLLRQPVYEQRVFSELATWAERFTSFVTLDSSPALLLEIAGSLRLFGGISRLRHRVLTELQFQGYSANAAIAPTPLAATWLARAGRMVCVDDPSHLHGALANLPLSCLNWPATVVEGLQGMGVTELGDCLRLPREGFAKRFGCERLLQLDRALGRLADPRKAHRTAERFFLEYDLLSELDDKQLLLNVCEEMLRELQHFLLVRQSAVQRLRFSFHHLDKPVTQVIVGCALAAHTADYWFELLKIRLESIEFSAPVIAIGLCSGKGQALAVKNDSLPLEEVVRQAGEVSIGPVVERLIARMGDRSIHGVQNVAEYRPQYAWKKKAVDGARAPRCEPSPVYWPGSDGFPGSVAPAGENDSLLRRPLWLLPQPRPLKMEAGRPAYQGVLTILEGPERLETGWWDESGITRDYYIALSGRGVRLWVYRDRGDSRNRWFLHGFFG
jgi:protein ImuB